MAHAIGKWSPCSAILIAVLGMVFLACNPNIERDPNENSGSDGERGKAQLLPFAEPVNDRVDYNEGDMTDWKYVQVPAPGHVTVTLGCDYTGAHCAANLRNEVGQLMEAIESAGAPRVTSTVPVTRGNYYLEIYVPASSTDYTVQVDYEPN